jgi:serine O-acetyltransferase
METTTNTPPPAAETTLHNLAEELCQSYQNASGQAVCLNGRLGIPQRENVIALLEKMLELLFPGYSGRYSFTQAGQYFTVGEILCDIQRGLAEQIERACSYRCLRGECSDDCEMKNCRQIAVTASLKLLQDLPHIRSLLLLDAAAALEGDPATQSLDEIILAYPGFKAICINRIAHELYAAGIPLIPRIMSEYAHTVTGIDINPGARIGKSFFIDHGTGVVIGETAVIGDNVKIYQGVTLGALSFPKDGCGKLVKGHKRHPNIEDSVTIYAGATILGDITIGHHSTIGGNVWLTASVPPYSKVTFSPSDISIHTRTRT